MDYSISDFLIAIVGTLWGFSFFAAIIWFFIAIRGRRVGNEPRCGRCGYEIAHLESGVCPECGLRVTAKTQTIGVRTRSARDVRRAILPLALWPLPIVAYYLWSVAIPRWSSTGMLVSLAESQHSMAMDELASRIKSGSVSIEESEDLIETALRLTRDGVNFGNQRWGKVLTDTYVAGTMTPEQRSAFLSRLLVFNYRMRPSVRSGDKVPIRSNIEYRHTRDLLFTCVLSPVMLHVGDASFQVHGERAFPASQFIRRDSSTHTDTYSPQIDAAPGKYEAVIRFQLDLYRLGPTPEWSQQIEIPMPLEVLPRDSAGSVTSVSDPVLDQQMKQLISIERLTCCVGPTDSQIMIGVGMGVTGTPTPSPVDVAFDVFIRIDGEVVRVENFAAAQGYSGVNCVAMNTKSFDAKSVDILLRSNPEAAEGSVDVFNVWQGELEFKDQTVTYISSG